MESLEETTEKVKTIRNLTQIYLLVARPETLGLLPTILEYLHELSQQIIEEFCIER